MAGGSDISADSDCGAAVQGTHGIGRIQNFKRGRIIKHEKSYLRKNVEIDCDTLEIEILILFVWFALNARVTCFNANSVLAVVCEIVIGEFVLLSMCRYCDSGRQYKRGSFFVSDILVSFINCISLNEIPWDLAFITTYRNVIP